MMQGGVFRRWLPLAALAFGLVTSAAQAGQCTMEMIGSVPVTMRSDRPLVPVAINGHTAYFVLDTGAMYSLVMNHAVAALGLEPGLHTQGVTLVGVGGKAPLRLADVDSLVLGKWETKDTRMLVAGSDQYTVGDDEVVGVLGEDFLRSADVEFDLPHHIVRFFRSHDCAPQAALAYWSRDYDQVDFQPINVTFPQIRLPVKVNDTKTLAVLSSGAYTSLLSYRFAERAKVDDETPVGTIAGLGRVSLKAWRATFGSVEVGEETIQNPTIKFADIFSAAETIPIGSHIPQPLESPYTPQGIAHPQMLLGADFLSTHRVLIAHSQNRLYFSYTGGTVFRSDTPTNAAPILASAIFPLSNGGMYY